MKFEIKMAPEELVYMAVKCDGENLDYEYVNMMKDVQVRGSVAEDEIIQSLTDKGIAEDNWGDLSFNEDAVAAMSPIWNGDFQSIIEIKDQEGNINATRIHKEGDKYVVVSVSDEGLDIKTAEPEDIEVMALSLKKEEGKSIRLGNLMIDLGYEAIEEFIVKDGQMCRPQDGTAGAPMSDDEYTGIAYRTLKGE